MLPPHRRDKPLHFMGSSRKDLRAMPDPVQETFGFALRAVQKGKQPREARPFGEGFPGDVMKLVEDFDRDTYRAAYTASFPEAVYVLHVFKKKSVSGIATPRPDRETIRARLQMARAHYLANYAKRGSER
jgi:phage-related protein